jgi:hypothetical protein
MSQFEDSFMDVTEERSSLDVWNGYRIPRANDTSRRDEAVESNPAAAAARVAGKSNYAIKSLLHYI